jgi:hypothetical protein
MVEGIVVGSEEGTPQGGPLSPLLANIYLDALDQELDRRGHSYCRYADDCNVYVRSQAAAERTLASIQKWIEKRLRLKLNAAKSGVGKTWERKFLGFRLNRRRQIEIAPESLERFKAKVRENGVTRACRYEPDLNRTYYEMAQHYGAAIMPGRPYKPRDKAKVENAVGVVGN